MLAVIYAEHYMKALYAECRYAESSGAPLMYSWKLGPGFVLLDYNFLDIMVVHSQIRLRLGALAEKTNLKRC